MSMQTIITTRILLFSTLVSITLAQCLYTSVNICQGKNLSLVKPRRYDIDDMGYEQFFHGWVDVQGQGAANDYCRVVGIHPTIFLACALAGTYGQSGYNYVSSKADFEISIDKTWYMKDEDGDGRDDYCRCLGENDNDTQVFCTRAGPKGFFGSTEQGGATRTFTSTGLIQCRNRRVRPEFGKVQITM